MPSCLRSPPVAPRTLVPTTNRTTVAPPLPAARAASRHVGQCCRLVLHDKEGTRTAITSCCGAVMPHKTVSVVMAAANGAPSAAGAGRWEGAGRTVHQDTNGSNAGTWGRGRVRRRVAEGRRNPAGAAAARRSASGGDIGNGRRAERYQGRTAAREGAC